MPPIETLTTDSDFTAFMQPNVGDALRRQALKKLFQDPHYNAMDGLDVYIDDYSKPDPIPEAMLKELAHFKGLFQQAEDRITDASLAPQTTVSEGEAAHIAAQPLEQSSARDKGVRAGTVERQQEAKVGSQ